MASHPGPVRLHRGDIGRRSRHIATVLTGHGLGWLADHAALGSRLPAWRPRPKEQHEAPLQTAVRLRVALGELGATFIKLGQMLSTRGDILPAEYVLELAKLQDAAPPVHFEAVERTVERELSPAARERIATIEHEPLASASIGQVHAAVLADGREVVIKVQRPEVAEQVEQDLEILHRVTRWLTANTAFGRDYDLKALADEFADTIRAELDYRREARNVETFAAFFADEPLVTIPAVVHELSTRRVLVLERVGGIKISNLAALDAAGLSRRRLAELAVRISVRQMLDLGVFHADPHPGNFFVRPDGGVAIVDFGMVGHLSEAVRDRLLRAGLSAIRRDASGVADGLFALGIVGARVRRPALERDLERVMDRYATATISDISAREVVDEVTGLAFRHHMQLPGELALFFRVLAMGEGMGLMLDPGFQFFGYVSPILRRHWRRRNRPSELMRRVAAAAGEAVDLGFDLPHRLGKLLGRAERGEIELNVQHEGLEDFASRFERMINRLALAVILAASIVALALTMVVYHPPSLRAFGDALLVMAFTASLVFGAWVLVAIWRSGGR